MILTGKRVRSYVSVMGEQVAMHDGIVVEDNDTGTCKVDRMSLHGGAPWIVHEAKSSLRVIDSATDGGSEHG